MVKHSAELQRALSPWTLGPLLLRNRIIKSATNEGMAPGGVPTQALVQHHRAMAAGGVGLTTVAYCAIEADGRTFPDQVVLDAATQPHLRVLTEAVHAEGAAISAQITHGGSFNFLPQLGARYPLSASGGFNSVGTMTGRWFKTAATTDDLAHLRQRFVHAARLAQAAGFDAVEIHMGHGYLLSQFLSPRYNRRRDAYGGSAEARARFPAEVLSAVLDAVGGNLAVICKLSMREGEGGAVDNAGVAAQALERAGAHLLVLSAGMNVESPWTIFGSRLPRASAGRNPSWLMRAASHMLQWQQPQLQFRELYLLDAARQLRAAVRSPLAYLGGAKSVAGIEQIMREGFDAVVMGRALIHQPDLIRQFAAGTQTQSGCTACNQCVGLMYSDGGTRCPLTTPENVSLNRLPAAH